MSDKRGGNAKVLKIASAILHTTLIGDVTVRGRASPQPSSLTRFRSRGAVLARANRLEEACDLELRSALSGCVFLFLGALRPINHVGQPLRSPQHPATRHAAYCITACEHSSPLCSSVFVVTQAHTLRTQCRTGFSASSRINKMRN